VKPLSIGVALAVLLMAVLPGQDLPPGLLLLARVKQHGRATFEHIPNYACLETIHRFEKPRNATSFRSVDTLHLEVASVDGKELFARQGAAFEDEDLHVFISQGVISSGAFSSTPLNLFVRDVARITPLPQEGMIAGSMLGFHFEESVMAAGLVVQSGGGKGQAGLRGAFWVDPQTLDLVRIEEQAVDLPPLLLMRDLTTSIDYARTHIGSSDPLLPQSAETAITDFYGAERKNSIEFSGCREYTSESTIHFGVPVPEPPPPAANKK